MSDRPEPPVSSAASGSHVSHAEHPCPKGDECALNRGAVTCKHCGRNWPPDETWNAANVQGSSEQPPVTVSGASPASSSAAKRTECEADRIDEQMQRAGGAPDERCLLGEDFEAENGLGSLDELRSIARANRDAMIGRGGVAICGDSPTILAAHIGSGCGQAIETVNDLYRCLDCDVAFHRDCLFGHFGQTPRGRG